MNQNEPADLFFLDTKTSDSFLPMEASSAQCRLVVIHPFGPNPIDLYAGDNLVGRTPTAGATVILPHGTVSRRHLRLRWNGEAHVIADEGSHNGTFVGGQRLTKGQTATLAHGDIVRCGDVVSVYERRNLAQACPPADAVRVPGESFAAGRLRAEIDRVARDPASALIIGETGTGKEIIAREMHRLSGRTGAFVALNCAALSPQLIESQLFGHVRGAFTGAAMAREGLFRAADGGTLFLDEIGELPLPLQPKLLRALQERRVRPVGGTREVAVNVRVVAATNQDLHARVADEQFRRDLYARLRMHEVSVPALRQRKADIVGWITHFRAQWQADRPGEVAKGPQLTPQAAEMVAGADWPENLRGVDQLVHRWAHIDRQIRPDELGLTPARLATESSVAAPDETPVDGAQAPAPARARRRPAPPREALVEVLRSTGSVRATARHYDRDRRQVYRWIATYNIEDAEFSGTS
ncbi:MAG: sigma 54-interacting transcriptional regulator [Myxococcales bacterium]|nr:sigma 54-interacting transcriptional regulator [Myxococcales bacterium]